MARILIAYTTHEGQTRKVVETIASEARELGHEVDLVDVAHESPEWSGTLDAYDGFLVAGSIRAAHHDPALVAFVAGHLEQLERKPSAFVSVSLSAGSPEASGQAAAHLVLQDFLHETG